MLVLKTVKIYIWLPIKVIYKRPLNKNIRTGKFNKALKEERKF
jgi:hypothetical protein